MINSTDNYTIPKWSVFENKETEKNTTMHYIDGIAYAIVSNEHDGIGYQISKLEVKEDQQGKGYGKRLMQFLIAKYEDVWFEPRNSSHNFYLKLGAKPYATHSCGWLFAINNKLPSFNWKLFVGDNINFCKQPDDNFVYEPEDWPIEFLNKLP